MTEQSLHASRERPASSQSMPCMHCGGGTLGEVDHHGHAYGYCAPCRARTPIVRRYPTEEERGHHRTARGLLKTSKTAQARFADPSLRIRSAKSAEGPSR